MRLKEKLTERIENDLWEMLECKNWTPCHVETVHYLAEIMRDIKKMEHYEKEEEMMAKRMPPPPPPPAK